MNEIKFFDENGNCTLTPQQFEQYILSFDAQKNNCDHNLLIIKEAYETRRDHWHLQSSIAANLIDRDMAEPLEAIYNVLNDLNNRLRALETKLIDN